MHACKSQIMAAVAAVEADHEIQPGAFGALGDGIKSLVADRIIAEIKRLASQGIDTAAEREAIADTVSGIVLGYAKYGKGLAVAFISQAVQQIVASVPYLAYLAPMIAATVGDLLKNLDESQLSKVAHVATTTLLAFFADQLGS